MERKKLKKIRLHLYNDTTAARYLGVTPMTVRNWNQLGLIESVAEVGETSRKSDLYTKEELDLVKQFITPTNRLKVTGEMIAVRREDRLAPHREALANFRRGAK